MSSLEINESGAKKKSKENKNENLQAWPDDFTTGMACRPPRTIRWERIHKNSLNLSGSLPSLNNRGDPSENHSPTKKSATNTKSTQTPPLSELLSLSPHLCRLDRNYCEEIRRRDKYHYSSLAHIGIPSNSGGGTSDNSRPSSSTVRRSSLCLGVTDWHQMGKELRLIADDLYHHRCSSTTSLDSTSSAESSLNLSTTSTISTTSSKTTMTTSNLHKTATNLMRDDFQHHLLHHTKSLSATSSYNDLRDKSNSKSK